MDDEIKINTIEWSAPEYSHKEKNNDWFWTIGLITIISCGVTIWLHNYIFSIFLLISGCCLIMFTIRKPQDINYKIETSGLSIGKDFHGWKSIKSFNIKKSEIDTYDKLFVETSKHFLPIYTIFLPKEKTNGIKETLLKVATRSEIHESSSMKFAEKLGF